MDVKKEKELAAEFLAAMKQNNFALAMALLAKIQAVPSYRQMLRGQENIL